MKLLVFAHTPPPVHGQSVMIATLLEGLRGDPEVELLHVNPRLSRDAADIGRWRPGKIFALLAACGRAWGLRLRHGTMAFYYVPAPGKRGALYRDWLVMLLCRPCFRRLVLHWHAVGLGDWLACHATPPERWLTRVLLGRADLAIVLAPELSADAQALAPHQIAIVPNGVPDPGPPSIRTAQFQCEVLSLGLGSRSKGLFDTLEGVALAHARMPKGFRLTFAGSFENAEDEREFQARSASLGPGVVRWVGFANEAAKRELFSTASVFCFPTSYPHEGQPLTLIEALAHDVPIITTRWRAIPGLLPPGHVWFVEPGRPDQIADALLARTRREGPPAGVLRAHYLAHFTREHHLAALAQALRALP